MASALLCSGAEILIGSKHSSGSLLFAMSSSKSTEGGGYFPVAQGMSVSEPFSECSTSSKLLFGVLWQKCVLCIIHLSVVLMYH